MRCGFGAKARAIRKMCARYDITGGRSFFEVTDRSLPRAFRAKARSHCAATVLGKQLTCAMQRINLIRTTYSANPSVFQMTLPANSKIAAGERWGATHLAGSEICQFLLRRLDIGESGEHWKEGITSDVVDFILENCKCPYCDSSITAPLAPCPCNQVSADWNGFELAAAYPAREFWDEVRRLYVRQHGRIGSRRRRAAVKENGGKISAEEKADLLRAQQTLCFYCGDSLVDQDGFNRYHCDHFVALINGGRNDLANVVMACARCNHLKNRDDGRYFMRLARTSLLIRDVQQLANMRKSFGLWRKSRGLRSLGSLGDN